MYSSLDSYRCHKSKLLHLTVYLLFSARGGVRGGKLSATVQTALHYAQICESGVTYWKKQSSSVCTAKKNRIKGIKKVIRPKDKKRD